MGTLLTFNWLVFMLSVQTLQPQIVIYIMVNKLIYRSLSYPFRSLIANPAGYKTLNWRLSFLSLRLFQSAWLYFSVIKYSVSYFNIIEKKFPGIKSSEKPFLSYLKENTYMGKFCSSKAALKISLSKWEYFQLLWCLLM